MAHPLVEQLRFTRREFQRDLEGLSDEDAVKRVGPANCIAWNISHLAWQEQRYWLLRGQGGHAPPGASTSSSPPEPPPARRLGHLAPLCTLKPRWRSNPRLSSSSLQPRPAPFLSCRCHPPALN
jgi:hypothetical protein